MEYDKGDVSVFSKPGASSSASGLVDSSFLSPDLPSASSSETPNSLPLLGAAVGQEDFKSIFGANPKAVEWVHGFYGENMDVVRRDHNQASENSFNWVIKTFAGYNTFATTLSDLLVYLNPLGVASSRGGWVKNVSINTIVSSDGFSGRVGDCVFVTARTIVGGMMCPIASVTLGLECTILGHVSRLAAIGAHQVPETTIFQVNCGIAVLTILNDMAQWPPQIHLAAGADTCTRERNTHSVWFIDETLLACAYPVDNDDVCLLTEAEIPKSFVEVRTIDDSPSHITQEKIIIVLLHGLRSDDENGPTSGRASDVEDLGISIQLNDKLHAEARIAVISGSVKIAVPVKNAKDSDDSKDSNVKDQNSNSSPGSR
ncbi:hypothetical protein ACHAP5_009626 [Fusarium lateritium]